MTGLTAFNLLTVQDTDTVAGMQHGYIAKLGGHHDFLNRFNG